MVMVADHWKLAQASYWRHARTTAHPMMREWLWDATVDGLLRCLRMYDGSRPFARYLLGWLKKYHACAWREAKRKKRDFRRDAQGVTDRVGEFRGFEAVDARDWTQARLADLTERQRDAVGRWMAGEPIGAVGRKAYLNAIRRLREAA